MILGQPLSVPRYGVSGHVVRIYGTQQDPIAVDVVSADGKQFFSGLRNPS